MVVPDSKLPEEIVYYLDGAHSPESMEACAIWFSKQIKQNQERSQKRSEQVKLFKLCLTVLATSISLSNVSYV